MQKLQILLALVCLPIWMWAQLSILDIKTTYVIDFQSTVAGVNNGIFDADNSFVSLSNPTPGRLDRDAFQFAPTNNGLAFNWPASPSNQPNGLGISFGAAPFDGIYAYSNSFSNTFLGVAPSGANFIPGGVILRVQNKTGKPLTQMDVTYRAYSYNNQNTSTGIQAFWSNDGSTWNAVSDLNYTSTLNAGAIPGWESSQQTACIKGTDVADNDYFYVKWVFSQASGIGPADEIGIDDIQILGKAPIVGFTIAESTVAEGNPSDGPGNTPHSIQIMMEAPPVGGNQAIIINTVPITATGGSGNNADYIPLPGLSYTFPLGGGCFPKVWTLPLQIKRNNSYEPNEDFKVVISLQNPGSAELDVSEHTISILNDDSPPGNTLYSRNTGAWSEPNMWSTSSGGGVYVLNPDNRLGSSGPTFNMVIQPGHEITLDDDKGINTLLIEKDGIMNGKLKVGNSVDEYFLGIHGGTVMVNGIMGDEGNEDGPSLEIYSNECIIDGSGDIDLSRIRFLGDASAPSDHGIVIQSDLDLRGSGTVLYNAGDNTKFEATINALRSVFVPKGHISIDGEDGNNTNNAYGELTVDGTLNIQDGNLYLRTNNPASGPDDITVQIRSNGQVTVGGSVIGSDGLGGNAYTHLIMGGNSTLNLGGTGKPLTSIDNSRNRFNLDPSSTIEFSGLLAQTIPSIFTYAGLKVSGGGDKSLEANTFVLGMLSLESGKIVLGDFNFNLGSGSSIAGGNQGSYLKTNGNGVVSQQGGLGLTSTFPVGNSSYNPLHLANSGTVDVFFVRVVDEVRDAGLSGNPVTNKVVNRSWLLSEGTPGGSNLTLVLHWHANDELTGFDRSDCYIANYHQNAWIIGSIEQATPIGVNEYILTDINVTQLSPFVVASSNSVLPVELTGFRAYAEQDQAILEWETAQEIQNDHFLVERSTDLRHFQTIGQVDGQGNSNLPVKYRFVDTQPRPGINYYRLRQVDFDGSFKFSDVETVTFPGSESQIELWPVPAKETISLSLPATHYFGSLWVEIYNPVGQLLQSYPLPEGPQPQLDISTLPAGGYILRLRGEEEVVGHGRFLKN